MTITPRLLFLGFLGLGLVTGLFLGSLGQAMAAPAHELGQHNTLFILVDDLSDENPTLKGIWLAANTKGSDKWNWMPIYPAPLDETDSQYAKPHSAFYLPTGDFSDVNSLPPLRENGVWWDEVFWLDETALTSLQVTVGAETLTLSDTWVEPQAALFEQVQVLNNLCKSASAKAAESTQILNQVMAAFPAHLHSSINPFELITRWDSWSQEGFALSCTHPWAD